MCQSVAEGGRRCVAHTQAVVRSDQGRRVVYELAQRIGLDRDQDVAAMVTDSLLAFRLDFSGLRPLMVLRRAAYQVESAAEQVRTVSASTDLEHRVVSAWKTQITSNDRYHFDDLRMSRMCPVDVLNWVATDEHAALEFRVAALKNERCPAGTLAAAAGDTNPEIRSAVVRHWRCPRDVVVRLSADESPEVRQIAVSHEHCPAEVAADRAVNDVSAKVRQAAVESVQDGTVVADRAVHDSDSLVRQAAVWSDVCPEDAVAFVALNDSSEKVRLGAFAHVRSPEVLASALTSGNEPSVDVRAYVATRRLCPMSALLFAATSDPDARVRRLAAEAFLEREDESTDDQRLLVALSVE